MDTTPSTAQPRTDITDFLFIGELAKQTGTDPKTIRFYERADLLSPPRHGRFRTYLASDVQRLKNVLRLRKMGVPIAQIREILSLVPETADVLDCSAASPYLTHHLSSLQHRQAELDDQLTRTRAALASLSG
jgi:DNA-binding transcriptional MerR regulator